MKRILVTGGAGFIGSHVVDALLASDCQVVVLDDFSTGKLCNLPAGNPSLKIVTGSVLDERALREAASGVDAIIHLAAIAAVQQSVDAPAVTHAVNFDATLMLLEIARQCSVSRILFASSAAVYGDPVGSEPVVETAPKNPLTPYAVDKLSSEYYLSFYQRRYGLNCTAFRFFNVFGERQNPSSPYSGVISIFCERASSGKDVVIYGDGQQVRDFVYVRDVARLIVDALWDASFFNKIMNVGTGCPTVLLELVRILERVCGNKISLNFSAARQGDIYFSLANVGTLRECWGRVPSLSLEVGLKAILDSYISDAGGK